MGKRRAVKSVGAAGPGAAQGKRRAIKADGSSGPDAASGKLPGHKKKINSKPKDLDTQEIPFKLREIMKSRMEMNNPKKKKKKKPANKQVPDSEEMQTDIAVPTFKRKQHESVNSYMDRMNRETQHVMFLSKNQPDRMPEKGVDEKGNPVKEVVKKEKSEKKKEFDRRRLNKFIKKREDKKEMRLEKDMFTDTVMFGEVVTEPPSLTVKPRKSGAEKKPGEKKLLLKSLFDQSSSTAAPPVMSLARKRLLEDERERVVQAYRALKKKKLVQTESAKLTKPHRT